MRVIAGKYGSRTLRTLDGSTTRPTTSRVKEALMSSLYSALPHGFEGITVLDAFAGSGALGIEALSRGAGSCVFCDTSAAARKIIQQNIKSLGAEGEAKILPADMLANPLSAVLAGKPFDLVLLDPPYVVEPEEVVSAVGSLEEADALSASCLVSYECVKNKAPAICELFNALEWRVVSNKNYGNTAVVILKRMRR